MDNGYIDEATAETALASPLTSSGGFERTIEHPYFTDEVRRSLDRVLGEGSFAQSGFSVQASLDSDLQTLADTSLRQGLITYDRRYGWRGAMGHIRDVVPNRPIEAIDFQDYDNRVQALGTPRPIFTASKTSSDFSFSSAHFHAFEAIEKPSSLHDWDMALVVAVNRSSADIRRKMGIRGKSDWMLHGPAP